jgi:putative peptidoglycan lipid II flippase
MVSVASLDYAELGRCLLAAVTSGAVVWGIFRWAGDVARHYLPGQIRWTDLALLVVGSGLWTAMTGWVLSKSGSALPRVMLKRLGLR